MYEEEERGDDDDELEDIMEEPIEEESEDSDFAEIITSTNTGVFFTYNEKEHLKKTIISYFELITKLTVKILILY
jgi:hypothetical protein